MQMLGQKVFKGGMLWESLMEKIKGLWAKLKYWQRGGLIGLILGIISYILLVVIGFKYAGDVCNDIFSCHRKEHFYLAICLLLTWVIYGTLLGCAFKILLRFIKIERKWLRYLIFLIVVLATFVVLYHFVLRHIGLFILILYSPPY